MNTEPEMQRLYTELSSVAQTIYQSGSAPGWAVTHIDYETIDFVGRPSMLIETRLAIRSIDGRRNDGVRWFHATCREAGCRVDSIVRREES